MHPRKSTDDRFETLEVKLAFHEQTLQELGDLIYAQRQQIDRLRATCRQLRRQIESLSQEAAQVESDDDRPPHY